MAHRELPGFNGFTLLLDTWDLGNHPKPAPSSGTPGSFAPHSLLGCEFTSEFFLGNGIICSPSAAPRPSMAKLDGPLKPVLSMLSEFLGKVNIKCIIQAISEGSGLEETLQLTQFQSIFDTLGGK